MLIAAQLCEDTNDHGTVHFLWTSHRVCKLFLNKAIKNCLNYATSVIFLPLRTALMIQVRG